MKISPIVTFGSSMARRPFRALHALVEFFAPWQRDCHLAHPTTEAECAALPSPAQSARVLDARLVAQQLRLDVVPHSHPAQMIVGPGVAGRRRPLRNTAVRAANQPQRFQPRPTAPFKDSSRPLRVFRAVDAHMPACASGRMVISGRIADVCAELERLSAAAQIQQA